MTTYHGCSRVSIDGGEDCIYRDPNTRGTVAGHEALRPYLTRLLREWRMHWSLRECFAFADGSGGAFLWDGKLTPAAGGKTTEISGMDLVLLRGERLSRNEVYGGPSAPGAKKRRAALVDESRRPRASSPTALSADGW